MYIYIILIQAKIGVPTLGEKEDAIKVKFKDTGGKEKDTPVDSPHGNLLLVDKEDGSDSKWYNQRLFHVTHYDEKGASVYICHQWRIKYFHPARRPLPVSRYTHGARLMSLPLSV